MTVSIYQVTYCADVSYSLDAFVQSYSPAAQVFNSCSMEPRLSAFYQHVLVPLVRYVARAQKESNFLSGKAAEELLSGLQLARAASVSVLRKIMEICCLAPSVEGKKASEAAGEIFLDSVNACLGEGGILLVDYARAHPIAEDLEAFAQAGVELDQTKVQYLTEGIKRLEEECRENITKTEVRKLLAQEESKSACQRSVEEAPGAQASIQHDAHIISLISQVKDLLPDLGDGFVKACLDYYNAQPEAVINSILEENLPPHLMDMDRKATLKQANPTLTVSSPTPGHADPSRVSISNSVFDGDEFDVNSRDSIDTSRIHKGKKNRGKNAEKMLNDKAHLLDIRDKFKVSTSGLGVL